jgi:hypothetical protein
MQRLIWAAILAVLVWSAAASGQDVRITISASDTSVRVGQRIPIQVELKNTSDHEIKLGRVGGRENAGLDYRVILLDSNGHSVARTKYGAAADTGQVESSPVLLQLGPGQTLTQQAELTKLFKITEPGTYTVRVGRKWPERTGKMEWSNSLTLTVTSQ